MIPELTLRAFSNDQYHLDKVFYANSYNLRGFKADEKTETKKPVVVDLGSHAGYFSFAALALGAERVYAFELNPDNHRLFLKNISDPNFRSRVRSWNVGVYTQNEILEIKSEPEVIDNSYYDFSKIEFAKEGDESVKVPAFSLDFILKKFVREPVDILKLNIGYLELEILSKSNELSERVSNICLETSEPVEEVNKFLETMNLMGFHDSLVRKMDEEEGKFLILLSKNKCGDVFVTK